MPLFEVTVFASGIILGIIISYICFKIFDSKMNLKDNSTDTVLILSLVERNHSLCRQMESMKQKMCLKDNSCHF